MEIKVLLIDSDDIWADKLKTKLETKKNLFATTRANTVEAAIDHFKKQPTDIILFDPCFIGNNNEGIALIKEIRNLSQAKIIICTEIEEANLVVNIIETGVAYYLLKREIDELPKTIEKVFNSQTSMGLVLDTFCEKAKKDRVKKLTFAEIEIANLAKQDFSIAKMQLKIDKSVNTIKNQLGSIYKKLNVKNMRELFLEYKDIPIEKISETIPEKEENETCL